MVTCVRGAPICRLEDLVVHLGLVESGDHRALSDSRLAMALFRHLAGRLEHLHTVEDLFRMSRPVTPDDSRTFEILDKDYVTRVRRERGYRVAQDYSRAITWQR